MVDLTVGICTYNGETRLPRVLDLLLSQRHTEHFTWEIIVIDNNSTDHTAKVVQEYQLNYYSTHPIHYYFESKQGLAFARRCVIKEAKGDLVAFLDDDNLPTPNWVYLAYSFGLSHPKAGAYGSQVQADYEVNPPETFKRIASLFAIIDRGQNPFRYDTHHQWLFPAGAGLVVRKQAWLQSVPKHPILKGVCGKSLTSKGEDLETLSYIRKAGWEIWHNPEMIIHHHIPRSRLEKEYLLQVVRGVGLSRYPIRMLRLAVWQKPFLLPLYVANDLRKLILHVLKYRQLFHTDRVVVGELELFWNSLISPFYHWFQIKDIKSNFH